MRKGIDKEVGFGIDPRVDHFIGRGQAHQYCTVVAVPVLPVPLGGELRHPHEQEEDAKCGQPQRLNGAGDALPERRHDV